MNITDKKIYFILPISIGKVMDERGKIAFAVDEALIKKCLEE